ncbi:MAG: 5'/3'-nucleotidase SurE [Muribaculaceae bacterium]|nr:5'/3'-nucleotidase SurE [Muribaculaceae bacterium]
MKNRPLILVSNDDGIFAKGVKALVERLVNFGDVVVVCPDSPRSGQSMAITVNEPLRITPLPDYKGARMYQTNGTPVDCIKLAMHHILDRRPDLVVSGINHGSNASVNELYSGTMGAACEGCAFGLPSIGFSLTDHSHEADFSICNRAVDIVVKEVLEHGLPDGLCLNVNIPAIGSEPKEMKIAVPCQGHWNDEYREYTDPAGKKFYLLSGEFINDEPENENTDEWCLAHGIVSVVPTSVNRRIAIPSSLDWILTLPQVY